MATGSETESLNTRKSELESFDSTKAGVKGLSDAGVTKIPRIFHRENQDSDTAAEWEALPAASVPIIDLHGGDLASGVVDEIGRACREWGFFQVVNHGIPVALLEEMIASVGKFHEQELALKKEFYSREFGKKKVTYFSNFDLFQAKTANWRDTLSCHMAPCQPDPEELPAICREAVIEYTKQIKKLGLILLELISKSLGIRPSHLESMDCGEGILILGHYYPPCPDPNLTWGLSTHTDASFITILLQDQIGGLQVLHDGGWFNVPPLPGALMINAGDFLQLITNGEIVSVSHRVVAQEAGPRVSVASFFRPCVKKGVSKVYGPITELLSEEKPPLYREVSPEEFLKIHFSNGLDGTSPLKYFRL